MKTIQLIRTPSAFSNKYVDLYVASIKREAEKQNIKVLEYFCENEVDFLDYCTNILPTLILEPCDWKIPEYINNLEKNQTAQVLHNLCITIRESFHINNRVLIINRSDLIGRPLADMLLDSDFTVTIAHSKSKNIQELIHVNDIIVLATGQRQDFDCINNIVLDVSGDYVHKKNICFDYVSMKEIGQKTTELMLSGIE